MGNKHAWHTRRWASKRCFFSTQISFVSFASHSFCFPAACIAMHQNSTIENRLLAHNFSPQHLKTRREWENTGTAWTPPFIEPSFRRAFLFICRGIFWSSLFFFIRFRIHMYNRYPESERVLVRFIKSLAGKTAKGYKRETQRDTRERERERIAIWDSVSWDHGFCYPPRLSDGTGDQVR